MKTKNLFFATILVLVAFTLQGCPINSGSEAGIHAMSMVYSPDDDIQVRAYNLGNNIQEEWSHSKYICPIEWTLKKGKYDENAPEGLGLHVQKTGLKGKAYVFCCGSGIFINDSMYSPSLWYSPETYKKLYKDKPQEVAPCSVEQLIDMLLEQAPDHIYVIEDTLQHDISWSTCYEKHERAHLIMD